MRRKHLVPDAVIAAALGGGAAGTIAIADGGSDRSDRTEHRFGGPPGGIHHGGPPFHAPEALADALGLTERQLFDRLTGGETVGEVAEAEGKDLDDVRAAVREELIAEIDEHLEDLGGFSLDRPGPPPGFGHGRP